MALTASAAVLVVCAVLPAALEAHSGGLDEFGCHAGSEPYHCHGGGSAPAPPVYTPPEPSGPTPAEIREQERQAALDAAEQEAASVQPEVDAARRAADAAGRRAKRAESLVGRREAWISDLQASADERRDELEEERRLAVVEVDQASADYRADVDAYRAGQALLAAAAGVAVALLLVTLFSARLGAASWFAALRTADLGIKFLALALPGVVGITLVGIAMSLASGPIRIALAVLGGLSIGALLIGGLQIFRTGWLLSARALLTGVAAVVLAVTVLGLAMSMQPEAPVPPAEQQILVAAYEEDPAAEGDPYAEQLEAKADRIDRSSADERVRAERLREIADDLDRAADTAEAELRKLNKEIEKLRLE